MSTAGPALGRLTKVQLRDAWNGEATDFTPWLADAENIAMLGEAIGIGLEVVGQEQAVGPFRADILCRDTVDGHFVLIENQLERTDHTHLGQILTYAAGLDAATIIWIAQSFTPEHRAALDWLNNATATGFNFFGLEVELWRIGDSAMAPKFNVVSKPNEWTNTVRQRRDEGPMTQDRQVRLDFWTRLRQVLADRGSRVRMGAPSYGSYAGFELRPPYFRLYAATEKGGSLARVYFQVHGPDKAAAFAVIEKSYGGVVDGKLAPLGQVAWRELPDATVSQVALSAPMDLADVSTWPATLDWMAKCLETMHELFEPIVSTLEAAGSTGPGAGASEDAAGIPSA